MNMRSTHNQSHHSGFSLIEVLVSLSIFTVVMTIGVGSLMALIAANAQARNTQAVMTNLSYALDSMTREIRTGSDYYCASNSNSLPRSGANVRNCETGGDALSFNEGGQSLTEDASSRRIAFRVEDGVLQRRLGNGDGDGNANEATDWIPVTSPNIDITTFRFVVTGTQKGEGEAPTVSIYMEGTAGADEETRSAFNIQTTVVQQLLDI